MVSRATTAVDRTGSSPRGGANAWISALLACFLVAATLTVGYLTAKSPLQSSYANAPQSIQTIRRFYAGLNEYLETGDPTAVSETLAPGALAFVPERGAMGDDSALLTYLLALRSTAPQLRFTIEHIEAGDDIAIASVRRSGIAGISGAELSHGPGISQEFFRVRGGRIVQHWSAAPGSVLLHKLTAPPMRAELSHSGRLAIAELTFPPGWNGPLPVDGPALILVQRGRLALVGDGLSQILDIATGEISVPGSNERAFTGPGQAILISEQRAVLGAAGPEGTSALIGALIDLLPRYPSSFPADRPPPPFAIDDISLMSAERGATYSSVQIRPLEFEHRSIPSGTWEFEVAWAVLGSAASLPISVDSEWALALVISGSAIRIPQDRTDPEPGELLTNTGDRPALALLIWLRPAA